MPARSSSPTEPRTRLAYARIEAGYTQEEMCERTGIKLGSYRRLERGDLDNPPLRWIMNCAFVLNCHYGYIWEPAWSEWYEQNGASAPTEAQLELWPSIAHIWPEPSRELIDPRPQFPWDA